MKQVSQCNADEEMEIRLREWKDRAKKKEVALPRVFKKSDGILS